MNPFDRSAILNLSAAGYEPDKIADALSYTVRPFDAAQIEQVIAGRRERGPDGGNLSLPGAVDSMSLHLSDPGTKERGVHLLSRAPRSTPSS